MFKNKKYSFNVSIEQWFALTSGLTKRSDWQLWAENGRVSLCDTLPADLIPPMMRRRMSSLSKVAVQVAISLLSNNKADYLIFSSRHGELPRTVDLLKGILSGEDASPMAFAQSVHNTAAGLTTIVSKQMIPVSSVSAKDDSFHQALIEAYCYLSENPSHKVIVIDFDEPLPDVYQQYSEGKQRAYAVGLVVSKCGENEYVFENEGEGKGKDLLILEPQAINTLKNILLGRSCWELHSEKSRWSWHQVEKQGQFSL